ncbi:hypothetical protein PIROE2DRAFT_20212 [Piromyces sp. E2]|nr:hypothetical protein PIROE2DRAFT_20212 [Piromyces sp. E2]|eukprot:OUM66179.1 hypothetical protein PIROE2DRAFT_20212 [Piromyces sp. E2]
MSGQSVYGPTCEVYQNFDACITNLGGNLDPTAWTSCSSLQAADMNKYNECIYTGYKRVVECFQSFCNSDTTNLVSTFIAARDQFEGIVNGNQQSAQQTTQQPTTQQQNGQQQTAQQQNGQQQTAQQQNGQQVGQQQTGQTGQTGQISQNGSLTNVTSGQNVPNANSGATSTKAKLFVTFLAISALAMNFI